MAQLRTAHTADLSASDLASIRELLDAAYDGDFGDDDWDHTLGGIHALVVDGDELVGHVAVVSRRLLHRDRALRTGYVEALAIRRDRRRHGLASMAMAEAERVIAAAYDLGALSDGTGIDGFYVRRGWLTWTGPTYVVGPTGMCRTEDDDGGVLVLPTATTPRLYTTDSIACGWRSGDVW